jgi:predicted MFS family arabinose efflux permease
LAETSLFYFFWQIQRFPARVSRNEGFNHAGNFSAAVLAGVIGQRFGYQWIFFLVCSYALGSAWVVALIRPSEIDHTIARGGQGRESQEGCSAEAPCQPDSKPAAIADLFRKKDLIVFLVSVILFHFGNAAMLPIRGILFALTDGPIAIVAIQLLDGVAAGIFGVISVVIASDLMRGTGRFNLAQGLVALATGLGASMSNVVAGCVVQAFGYSSGFMTLAGVAMVALIFFAILMPETGPRRKVTLCLTNPGLSADIPASD